ncbi:MAG: hypothetical protein O2968_02325 [Acidobacteria bacterium]|nr:hypothetical protein [Acidobacteriota bacterium]
MKTRLLFLVLLVAQHCWGLTTLVAHASNGVVFIGADSKETLSGTDRASARLVCKIQRSGNFVQAASGLAYSRGVGWDVSSLFVGAAREAQNLSDFIGVYVANLKYGLPRAAESVRKNDPAMYERLTEPGKYILQTVVATTSPRGAQGVLLSFWLTEDNVLGGAPNLLELNEYVAVGTFVEAFVKKNAVSFDQDPEAAIRRIIENEIKLNTSEVGPPIDIVRLDSQGVHWLEHKPQCGESREAAAQHKLDTPFLRSAANSISQVEPCLARPRRFPLDPLPAASHHSSPMQTIPKRGHRAQSASDGLGTPPLQGRPAGLPNPHAPNSLVPHGMPCQAGYCPPGRDRRVIMRGAVVVFVRHFRGRNKLPGPLAFSNPRMILKCGRSRPGTK